MRTTTTQVTYPALADDPGPRRTIKISGMAPVETGPYANQARVTMQDGSTLCLIPALSGAAAGFIEVRREREREGGESERERETLVPGLAGAAAGFMEVCVLIYVVSCGWWLACAAAWAGS